MFDPVQRSAAAIYHEISPKFSRRASVGLYMVKKVVESMQGSVQAANVGQGAEFTLRLPAHPGPAA